MADNRDTQLNLAVLQRLDNSISSIVDSASQVALYKFSSGNSEWEKTEIEGTLFVYMRSKKPQHGFIVMNRVNTTNFIEPVTNELEFQIQAPFLLYRSGKGHIHGIWFYEQEQCKKIGKLLQELSQLAVTKKKVPSEKQKRSSPRTHHQQKKSPDKFDKMDIMSLLTRAQEEYDKRFSVQQGSPTNVESHGLQKSGILKPKPVRANGLNLANGSSMPITVDKLFAQVGDGKHVFKGNNVKQSANFTRSRSYSSRSSNQAESDLKLHCAEDILQKLMLNTTSSGSLEAERDHDSTKVRVRSATYSSAPFTVDKQTSEELVEQDLKKKLNILPKCETVMQHTKEIKINPSPNCDSHQDPINISRTQAVDIPILTPAMLEMSSSLPTSSELPFGMYGKKDTCSEAFIASSFPKSTIPKPLSPDPLLSPMDFKVSIKNSSSSLDESPPSPPELRTSFINNSLHCFGGNDDYGEELLLPQNLMQSNYNQKSLSKPLRITPLTKNQLREALGYMIQNDEEFVNQLHECYLKSLKSQLNGQKFS